MQKLSLLISAFLCWVSTNAQILSDPATQQLVLQCVEKSYNYEFQEANELLKKIKAKYPTHPVTTLLPATMLYWQYLPLKDSPQANAQYVKLMEQCIEQANVLIKKG